MRGHATRATLLLFCLWWGACATATKGLEASIIPAFRAESAAVASLADLDERILATAQNREEVEAWKKKYESIRAGLLLFHDALSTVAAVLLGEKK